MNGVIVRGKDQAKEPLYTQVAVVPCSSSSPSRVKGLTPVRRGNEAASLASNVQAPPSSRQGQIADSGMSMHGAFDVYLEEGDGKTGNPLHMDMSDVRVASNLDEEYASGKAYCREYAGGSAQSQRAGDDPGGTIAESKWALGEKIIGLITCQVRADCCRLLIC